LQRATVSRASAETQLNPSIDPAGAIREQVEVLLQLLGNGSSWRDTVEPA
jgi:hypothetical protein